MKNFKNALEVIGGIESNPIMIVSDENGITTNANAIKEVVAKAEIAKDNLIKSGSLLQIETAEKELKKVHKWLKDSRIEKTRIFDDIKKEFTQNENILLGIIKDISGAKDLLLEEEYRKAEKNIEDFGWIIIDEYDKEGIKLEISLLKHFIASKRTLKGYRGKLGKAQKDDIRAVFDDVADKIKEDRELQKQKDLETKQFMMMLKKNSTKEDFAEMLEDIESLFPNIHNSAAFTIKNEIARLERLEKSAEKIADEIIEEKKAKKAKEFFSEEKEYRIAELDFEIIKRMTVKAKSAEEASAKMLDEIKKIFELGAIEEV